MSKRRVGNSDIRKLLRAAREAGLEWFHGGKHLKLMRPGSPGYVTVSATPSSSHAVHHIGADIRRTFGVCL